MHRPSRHSDAGFSIVEMLVAAGILAVALASLAGLFPRAVEVNLAARTRVHATLLAVQKIEELRASVSGGEATSAAGEDRVASSGETVGATGAASSDAFVRRWRLESAAAGFVLVQVEVRGPATGILAQERAALTTLARVGS